MIGKVVSTAVTLWLKSQVERVEELQLEINSSNREILRGYIPKILLTSRSAVYQGIHLRQVQLQGVNIRVNLSEIVKGKPLKLLEPISVKGKVFLSASDLNASLDSTLLLDGLQDVLVKVLNRNSNVKLDNYQINWYKVILLDQKLIIEGSIQDSQGQINSLHISTGLQLSDCHTLLLSPFEVQGLPEVKFNQSQSLEFDLGQEVTIEHLAVVEESLTCIGSLTVMP